MPYVRLPLSGDVLQAINPWTWFNRAVGTQVGLVNINLGRSGDPDLEEQILDEVGSYGRQLGRIGDVLGILIRDIDRSRLGEQDLRKIEALERQLDEIEALKAQRSGRGG